MRTETASNPLDRLSRDNLNDRTNRRGALPLGNGCRHWWKHGSSSPSMWTGSAFDDFRDQHAAGDGRCAWLFTIAGDAAHGILMFPVLSRPANGRRWATSVPGSWTPRSLPSWPS